MDNITKIVREKLINCDTHFDNDQIEAIMRVIEDCGYSDMYEALVSLAYYVAHDGVPKDCRDTFNKATEAIAKAEGK